MKRQSVDSSNLASVGYDVDASPKPGQFKLESTSPIGHEYKKQLKEICSCDAD